MTKNTKEFNPYLLAEAVDTLKHTKIRLSHSSKLSVRLETERIVEALSEYRAVEERNEEGVLEIKRVLLPGTGGSFDLLKLAEPCRLPSSCRCYNCATNVISDRSLARKFSQSYVDRILGRWQELVKLAVQQVRIPNTFVVIQPVRERKIHPNITVFTPAEVRFFLQSVKEPRARCAFYIAVVAGLRKQEILHLRREDIVETPTSYVIKVQAKRCFGHTSCRRNRVPNEVQRQGEDVPEWGWWKTKTRENRDAACALGLKPHLEEVLSTNRGSNWLFPGVSTRHPLTLRAFHNPFVAGLKQVGLYKANDGRWSFHTCRRTFITSMIGKKLSTAQVGKMAGCTEANIENYLAYNPTENAEHLDNY